jgi:hypothetical protein
MQMLYLRQLAQNRIIYLCLVKGSSYHNYLCHYLIIIILLLGVNNHCIQQQSKKFTTLFMQLNSTSASDLNSDMKEYIFVRDAERRQQEALKNSINDIKEIIKENFKSVKDDMTEMDGSKAGQNY